MVFRDGSGFEMNTRYWFSIPEGRHILKVCSSLQGLAESFTTSRKYKFVRKWFSLKGRINCQNEKLFPLLAQT
jgi:hypothetical protein